MKSNKYCKEENIIFFLLVLFGLFICVLFICDLIQDSKRIENPSIELIEKVEKKYLNGNLVDDFKVDDSIFNKPTADGEEDCDIYWKNSQNIKFSKREVYFNDEVIIKVNDLSEDNRNLFENLFEREQRKCFLDRKQKKINKELSLVK
jgi:hypothetical protein